MIESNNNKTAFEHFIFSSLDYLRGNWDSSHAVNLIFGLVFLRKLEYLQQDDQPTAPFQFQCLPDWCANWSRSIVGEAPSYVDQMLPYLSNVEACHPQLHGIFDHLKLAIHEDASSTHLLPFLKELCTNDQIVQSIQSSELGALFNICLNKLAIGLEKKHKKIFTPQPINTLLASALSDQPFSSIMDPAVGFAGTLLSILSENECERIHIIDKNPFALILARMNLIVNGYYQFTHQCCCAITAHKSEDKYERIVCHMPFGQQISTDLVKDQSYLRIPFDISKPTIEGTSLFFQKLLYSLQENGQMGLVIPTQYLHSKGESKKLREYLVKRGLVARVIALPYGLLQRTSGPISLLIIDKANAERDDENTLFVNAMGVQLHETGSLRRELTTNSIRAIKQALVDPENIEFVRMVNHVEIIDRSEIMQNECNLDAKHYASLTRKQLKELARVGSLVQIDEITLPEQPALWFNDTTSKPYPYVRIGDLGFTYSNYPLRVENCIMSDQLDQLKAQLISQSCLLVNRSGDRFLASFFEHEGVDILVDESIISLFIDKDKVTIDYLIMKLFDRLFIEQINMIKKEDQNKEINERQFKKLCIEYFTKPQQEKWVKNRKIELLIAGEKKVNQLKNDIFKGKLKAYADQMRIISSIQHELGNKLPAVLTEFKNLRYYLEDLSEKNEVYRSTKKIYDSSFENEQIDTFDDVFCRIEAILAHSIHSIDATSDIIKADRSKMNFEEVNLKDFFTHFLSIHQSDPLYSIQLDFQENEQGQEIPILTQIDRVQFQLVLSNLVENAKRHGFKHDKRYTIQFQVGLSADLTTIIIIYKNDGLPFPDGYTYEDFIGFGNYAGQFGHSGIGGYLINRIIENHNGSMRFLPPTQVADPYKVKFEINIPAIRH